MIDDEIEVSEVTMTEHFAEMFTDDDFDILLLIGGYGSGKSFTGFLKTAIKATVEKRKILVVRKVYSTIKESCYEDLKDGLEIAGVSDEWKFIKSPLEANHLINGSKIIFRGLDDWRKIKSIKNIDYIIVEEADEMSLEDLKELRKRLRVKGVKKHIVFMCNPVSRASSIYRMFFTDDEGFGFDEEELYEKRKLKKIETIKLEDGTKETITIKVHHSTYKDNLFLPPTFIYELESEKDPRLKRIACEGKFGADGDLVLHNAAFEENVFERYIQNKIFKENYYRGVDWGYSKSYATGLKMAVNESLNELYIYWEFYNRRMTTRELAKGMEPLKEDNVKIFGDSASAQANADFRDEGFRIFPCGTKDRTYGEQMLRSFSRIVIDKWRCPNTKKEVEECIYKKDKRGEIMPGEYNIDPHSIDTMKYGLSDRKYVPLKERRKDRGKFVGV